MVATPMWFGDESQFGWLHVPASGTARSGVIICPSLGMEEQWSFRAVRLLAESLEEAGFAVLRYDHPGAGHSVGDLEHHWAPGILDRGLRHAAAFLARTGVDNLAFVGVRLGAAIVARAAAHLAGNGGGPPVRAVAMWSPPSSGRSFLREQKALRLLAIGHDQPDPGAASVGDDQASVSGNLYPAPSRRDIESLDFRRMAPLRGIRTLLVTAPAMETRTRQAVGTVADPDWIPGPTTEDLFFRVADATPARQCITAMVGWLDSALPRDEQPLRVPSLRERVAFQSPAGPSIVERAVSVGPDGLFGVLTEPDGLDRDGGPSTPSALFVNTSIERCLGPGRMWVNAARALAGDGWQSLRLDLSGLGDSPARPDQARFVVYQDEAIQDIEAAVAWLAPDDPGQVALLGYCSGAYNSLEANAGLVVRNLCTLNPVLDFTASSRLSPPPGGGARRRAASPRRKWLRAFSRRGVRRSPTEVPRWVWWALHVARLQRSPAAGLPVVVPPGSHLLLLCGPADAENLEWRGGWILRKLERAGRLTFRTIPDMDHALLAHAPRQAAQRAILDHLLGRRDLYDDRAISYTSNVRSATASHR